MIMIFSNSSKVLVSYFSFMSSCLGTKLLSLGELIIGKKTAFYEFNLHIF
ncbi:hypothetical protein HanPI659440_Chr17g0681581 [Helianthus annuus]|nr:hypothetical protein HanPI659440_Chr17g0681581 [Helianthus annuus]